MGFLSIKEARARGLRYGDQKAGSVLKHFKEHVSLADLADDEQLKVDEALAVLEAFAERGLARWKEEWRRCAEENHARYLARQSSQEGAR